MVHWEQRLTPKSEILHSIDYIISYGYQYILKDELLRMFPGRVINMHIAYLPWNRGTDPNMWSFLEDTPKGVTIHMIDPGIDTGGILAQTEVEFAPNDTLSSSYARLSERIEKLFIKIWPEVKSGRIKATAQQQGGSFHLAKEKKQVEHLLHSGWDTPVADLIGRAQEKTAQKTAREKEVSN